MRRYCAEVSGAKMANSVSVFPGSESRTHGLLQASPGGFREKRRRDMSDTVIINEVRWGLYLDSVALMRLSRAISEREGVSGSTLPDPAS